MEICTSCKDLLSQVQLLLLHLKFRRSEDVTKLWHMRLGHVSERGMQIFYKADLLGGHKVTSLEFCEQCVFGKLHGRNFL